jgi:Na+/H+ antiporter NhaD/arsenite permease-like protein
MTLLVVAVFVAVYLGMILGRIPGLALDRTGLALLGAIVLFASSAIATDDLLRAVNIETMAVLFGLMIVSAQFRLAGTYSHIVRQFGRHEFSPPWLLATILSTTAALSALLINDIVCLAVTPVVIEVCHRKQLDPVPFLLGVACSANIGSAATLIGNPQNILIGQTLKLSFSGYLLDSLVPVMLSMACLWGLIYLQYRRRWLRATEGNDVVAPPFSLRQTVKGSVITVLLLLVFLEGTLPREIAVLTAAALLLCSRRMRSREILGIVDWQLLVLFLSLFVVNYALQDFGALEAIRTGVLNAGADLRSPGWLFVISAGLSNIVSNVPAVMLLLPFAHHPTAGPVLALASTFAGNLLIVGSIANIIVIDQACRLGVPIGWKQHFKTGLPITIISLVLAGLWLWLRH